MFALDQNSNRRMQRSTLVGALMLILVLLGASASFAKDKKAKINPADDESVAQKQRNLLEGLDLSKIVWPNPPAITRIKYLNYWSGEKFVAPAEAKKKASWMERVSGIATG